MGTDRLNFLPLSQASEQDRAASHAAGKTGSHRLWPWFCCLVFLRLPNPAHAQNALVFERQPTEFPSVSQSSKAKAFAASAQNSDLQFESEAQAQARARAAAQAQTPPEYRRPAVSTGPRPSFLAPPESADSPLPQYGGQAGLPEQRSQPTPTIVTQIEVPVPPQTAEPLTLESTGPAPASANRREPASRGYVGYAGQTPAPVQQQQQPRQYSQPVQTQAPEDRYREPAYEPRVTQAQAQTTPMAQPTPDLAIPVTPTSEVDPSQADGPPTVIYEKGQPAAPGPTPVVEAPRPDFGLMLRQRRYSEVEPVALESNDSRLASAIGWAHYQDGRTELAYQWFEKAIHWNESNYEAAYGMALSLYRMGKYSEAEEVARWRMAQYPKMKRVLGDVLAGKAVASFRAKHYKTSRDTLLAIQSYRGLSREERIMMAWDAFNMGNVDKARVEFERLYREKQDRYSADGVYAAYARQRDWQGLETVSNAQKGPLRKLYLDYVGGRYYDMGLHRMAYAQAPDKYPQMENIDSPVVGGSVEGRFRSGTPGTSELTEFGGHLTGTLYADGLHRLDVTIGVRSLNSGDIASTTLVGKVPIPPKDGDGTPAPFRYGFKSRYDSLFDANIHYEYQGLLTPWIDIGITPSGGAVNPTLVGAVGLRKAEDWGSWSGEIYREAVTDSLLSYTGLRDPYTNSVWGRVTETGARFSLFSLRENNWGFYGAASGGVRSGQNVQSNDHLAVAFALNKSIPQKGFENFTVGPSLSFEHFGKNLSQFTYGQGGYFSPSFMVQGLVSARFMTDQGKSSLVRGSLGVGIQSNHQDSTPLFPNNPDGRWLGGISSTGAAVLLNVEGLYQLTDQWTVGAGIAYDRAPDYTDFSVRLTMQYFFEPRKGLYAQDFLTF